MLNNNITLSLVVLILCTCQIFAWKYISIPVSSPRISSKSLDTVRYNKISICRTRPSLNLYAVVPPILPTEKPRPKRKVKPDCIVVQGKILDVLPNASFKVEIEPTKNIVVCSICGKIRKNLVRVIAGDKVDVEISTYDLGRGRIVYRSR